MVPTIPLFPGIPGGPELVIVFLIFGFFALIGIGIGLGLGYWVYKDATGRGNDQAGLWGAVVAVSFLAGLLPGVLVLAAYLVTQR
jgi:hypothetical protein